MRRVVLVVLVLSLALVAAQPVTAGETAPSRRAHVAARVQHLGHIAGRLQIPAIGLDEVVREGVGIDVINRGVAHWAGTAQPGGMGNLVLAGHRTTYTRPFHDIDELEAGDEIVATGIDGRQGTYRVTETIVVHPGSVWIADWTDTPSLTMFACHPKGSARQRIVVRAELVDAPVVLP